MTEGVRYRIGIATQGFRGGVSGQNFYINETITLDEGKLNVDIIETVPVTTIEVVSVEVSSLEVEGAY